MSRGQGGARRLAGGTNRSHLPQKRPELPEPEPRSAAGASEVLPHVPRGRPAPPAPPSEAVGPIRSPGRPRPTSSSARARAEVREPRPAARTAAHPAARCPRNGVMTAEETKTAESGAQSAPLPLEGVDIQPQAG